MFGSTKYVAPPDPTPFGAQTERIDTNQAARILPWFAGTVWVGVTWIGDVFNVRTTPITTQVGKNERTTGYNYYASFAGLISNGVVDFITKIKFDDEVVWDFRQPHMSILLRGPDEDSFSVTIPNRGVLKFYWGTETQGIDTLLANSGQEHSAYRGQCYVIGQDIFFGADKTNAPNIQVQVQRFPYPSWIPSSEKAFAGLNANPVCILREWWTGKRFGLGRSESELDIPRLQAASTRLYQEGNFLSPFFDSQTSLKDGFIKMFEYLDAYPTSYGGKFGFELVRPISVNVPLLTKSDFLDDPQIDGQTWADTYDETRVKFKDFELDGSNSDNLEKHHEMANFIITGRHKALELDRPWITQQFQAGALAGAAGRVNGLPQSKGSLRIRESSAASLGIGSVFDLATRDGTMRMRVIEKQEPNPDKNDVSISFESDRGWANFSSYYTAGQDAIADGSVFSPEPPYIAEPLDAPYAFSDTRLSTLMMMVARSESYSTTYDVWRASNLEGPYSAASAIRSGLRFHNFSVRAKLTADYSSDTLPIDDLIGIAFEVRSPDQALLEGEWDLGDALNHTLLAFIGDGTTILSIREIMSLFDVTKTSDTTYTAKVLRGLYDTRRRTHFSGTELWLQLRIKVDALAWTPFSTDPRYFKFQPYFGRAGVSLSDVSPVAHSENGRSLLPIAPMNVRFDGDASHAIWNSNTLYTSDFSAGEDGWSGQLCGALGNIDSIGGLDDSLEAIPTGGLTALHFVKDSLALVDGQQYRVKLKVYIRSAHADAGALIDLTGVDSVTVPSTTQDAWVQVDATLTAGSSGLIRVWVQNNGGDAFSGDGTPWLYIREVSIVPLTGSNTLSWSNTSRARTVFGLAFNEAPATDLTDVQIDLLSYDGVTLLDSFNVTPDAEETAISNTELVTKADSDFQIRVYGLRNGLQSLDYTSVLVRKVAVS
jgi:hypothetical protein